MFEQWSFTSCPPTPALSEGGWWSVEHNRVRQPFKIRVGQRGGAYRVVGLVVDNREEITSDLLRSIRLGELLEQLLDEDFWLDGVNQRALGSVLETAPQLESKAPRARRGNPPGDHELRAFAAAYLTELEKHPRRAMHEVTKKGGHIPMARSTGYRWLRLARAKGFLAGGEDS